MATRKTTTKKKAARATPGASVSNPLETAQVRQAMMEVERLLQHLTSGSDEQKRKGLADIALITNAMASVMMTCPHFLLFVNAMSAQQPGYSVVAQVAGLFMYGMVAVSRTEAEQVGPVQ